MILGLCQRIGKFLLLLEKSPIYDRTNEIRNVDCGGWVVLFMMGTMRLEM